MDPSDVSAGHKFMTDLLVASLMADGGLELAVLQAIRTTGLDTAKPASNLHSNTPALVTNNSCNSLRNLANQTNIPRSSTNFIINNVQVQSPRGSANIMTPKIQTPRGSGNSVMLGNEAGLVNVQNNEATQEEVLGAGGAMKESVMESTPNDLPLLLLINQLLRSVLISLI